MNEKIEQPGFFEEPQRFNFGEEEKTSTETKSEILHEPITRENILGALLRTRGNYGHYDKAPSTQLVAKEARSGPKYVFYYNNGKGFLTYEELQECTRLLESIDVEAEFEAADKLRKQASPVQELRNVDVSEQDDDEDERRGYKRDGRGINYI